MSAASSGARVSRSACRDGRGFAIASMSALAGLLDQLGGHEAEADLLSQEAKLRSTKASRAKAMVVEASSSRSPSSLARRAHRWSVPESTVPAASHHEKRKRNSSRETSLESLLEATES